MSASPAYIPGRPADVHRPLWRYLPPIPDGVGQAWLHRNFPPGAWVLDPFGASPRLAVEAARAGYRVLVAAHNPIAHFLLELHAAPPSAGELRAALADLAVASRAGERLEPHIRALYITECANCGRPVEAQAFVWERNGKAPAGRIYNCPVCKDPGEHLATSLDNQRAAQAASRGLHWARALERVAPLDDPDRVHAEEALAMYLPRAVYALFTLVNKLEGLPPGRRKLLEALLLAAFDQADVLWAHPTERLRPKQLTIPPRFLEKNVWSALEAAVEDWATSLYQGDPNAPQLPLTAWPDLPPESGGLCLFEGRLKDLASQIQSDSTHALTISGALAALPRPNQAFWTLSALWAGWLWGHKASQPFHSVLRRRRYDWAWHTVALSAAFQNLAGILEPGVPCLGLISEAEPGFISAAILAAETASFDLQGVALRAEEDQAQVHWRRSMDKPKTSEQSLYAGGIAPDAVRQSDQALQDMLRRAIQDYLRQRGEPAPYLHLHAASLVALAQVHALPGSPDLSPADRLRLIEEVLAATLAYRAGFAHYGGSGRSLEIGQWWLSGEVLGRGSQEVILPLADRVEMEVVRFLQNNPACQHEEVDRAICAAFPGLLTPDPELVLECLRSYGKQDASGGWRLRPEDAPAARRRDLAAMSDLLCQLGGRLGYIVDTPVRDAAESPSTDRPLVWLNANGGVAYAFHLLASAVLQRLLQASTRIIDYETAHSSPNLVVLPGGRAGLAGYKLRHDPRLRLAVESGWQLVKFRHLRWLAETEGLTRDNLDELLARDPLANKDPQMQLL